MAAIQPMVHTYKLLRPYAFRVDILENGLYGSVQTKSHRLYVKNAKKKFPPPSKKVFFFLNLGLIQYNNKSNKIEENDPDHVFLNSCGFWWIHPKK